MGGALLKRIPRGLNSGLLLQSMFVVATALFVASVLLGLYSYYSIYQALPDIRLEHLRQADQLAADGDPAAVNAYNIAARLAPDDAGAVSKLYVTAQQWDDSESSWWALLQALRIDAANPTLNSLVARGYYERRDYASSRRYYRRSLMVDRWNVGSSLGLALSEYQLGNHAHAGQWFQRVLELEPAHADARYYLDLLVASEGEGKAP